MFSAILLKLEKMQVCVSETLTPKPFSPMDDPKNAACFLHCSDLSSNTLIRKNLNSCFWHVRYESLRHQFLLPIKGHFWDYVLQLSSISIKCFIPNPSEEQVSRRTMPRKPCQQLQISIFPRLPFMTDKESVDLSFLSGLFGPSQINWSTFPFWDQRNGKTVISLSLEQVPWSTTVEQSSASR